MTDVPPLSRYANSLTQRLSFEQFMVIMDAGKITNVHKLKETQVNGSTESALGVGHGTLVQE